MTRVDVLCVGHASFDLVMVVDHHPEADEKTRAISMVECGGGPAANAAVAVVRLGGTSAFVGYLGDDLYGEKHLEELIRDGVATGHVVRGEAQTPLSVILVKPDGKRTVINHSSLPPLSENETDLSDIRARCLLFDGHEPLISVPLAKKAKKAGIPTVLDAGSVHHGSRALAPLVDYLVASERFARDFTGETGPARALEKLAGITPSVVITLGDRGLVWSHSGEEGELPACQVDAVDTTGAGDAFHGAFALGVAQNMAWDKLLCFASATAALTCTTLGARRGIPSIKDLSDFMRQS